ncbi:MAG: Hsp20/alpha crystallin family protein [Caulobacteraceae bacterium]
MTSQTPVPVRKVPSSPAWPATGVFSSFYDGFDHFLDTMSRTWPTLPTNGHSLVRMDCAETEDGLELTAEMPGLKEKDVQVVVSDGVLTISGEKRAEREQKDKGYMFVERSYGAFSRSVDLPADIDSTKIKATIADGVLKVVAPRRAKTDPQKIEVQASA